MSECLPDFTPDFPGAAVAPSPNHGERLDVVGPDIILLHYTGMTTADGALSWLCNPESQVSSHYFVFEDGRVIQMVPETRRAWHAGKSTWAGDQDINSRSIGIEIANQGHPGGLPEFPKKQVDAVIELCRDCGQRWNIAPERVLAHSDVAPIRKVDPGEKFPWTSCRRTVSVTGWSLRRSAAGAFSSAATMGSRWKHFSRCCPFMDMALK